VLVLGALTILTVMLTEFQDETSADLGSALSTRDALNAEYAAASAVNLSRLLIATEPTIRKALAPLFLLMKRGPPQIPVWEFADRVLGAFNDTTGAESFSQLAGVKIEEGKNLGLTGAGFEVKIVDEDSKLNVNLAARGDAFSQTRLCALLIGLIQSPQYGPLFENRDADGNFSDRQTISSAIIDWTDPDQDGYLCDPSSATAQQAAAEDSYYEQLKKPYSRKNAAFDSLEELHMVRGVGDDFWSTFVDPDPDEPSKRVVTVWGQGAVNVNTANPETLWALICGNAVPGTPLCNDPNEASKFMSLMSLLRGFTQGAPLFGSAKGFINALKCKGMFEPLCKTAEMQPVQLLSEDQLRKGVTVESKVFSIYSTGYVRAGKRETRVRIHAVVDFRGAPPPGAGAINTNALPPPGTPTSPPGQPSSSSNTQSGAPPDPNALTSVLEPSPAGNVIYYKVN
jgi:general secretion pathway protein K